MKNPFFIFAFWLLFFLLEILFPWEIAGVSFKPYGSFFVLGYAFFILPLFALLLFSAIVFVIQSSYSYDPLQLLFLMGLLGLVVFWVRRKTYSENLGARAMTVFFTRFLGFYFWEAIHDRSFFILATLFKSSPSLLLQGLVNFVGAIVIFWILEEPGSIWEERFFSFRAKKGQLHLFEARHLRRTRRSPFKVQRRIRRRFGLRDSW